MDIEDRGFVITAIEPSPLTNIAEAVLGAFDGLLEPCNFGRDLVIVDDALPNDRHLPTQEVHRPNDNARRRG
jgi:hypothetical protein